MPWWLIEQPPLLHCVYTLHFWVKQQMPQWLMEQPTSASLCLHTTFLGNAADATVVDGAATSASLCLHATSFSPPMRSALWISVTRVDELTFGQPRKKPKKEISTIHREWCCSHFWNYDLQWVCFRLKWKDQSKPHYCIEKTDTHAKMHIGGAREWKEIYNLVWFQFLEMQFTQVMRVP